MARGRCPLSKDIRWEVWSEFGSKGLPCDPLILVQSRGIGGCRKWPCGGGDGNSGVEGSEVAVAGEAMRFMRRVKRPEMLDDCQNKYLGWYLRGAGWGAWNWGPHLRGKVSHAFQH